MRTRSELAIAKLMSDNAELGLIIRLMAGQELVVLAQALADASPATTEALEKSGLLDVVRGTLSPINSRVYLRGVERFAIRATQAAERLKRLGIEPVAIPDKTVRAVFENLSVEEDENMAQVWESLLVNAMSGKPIPPAYPEILRQLEPIEARFANGLALGYKRLPPMPYIDLGHIEEVAPLLGQLEWRHLDNLERLQVIAYSWTGPVNVERVSKPGAQAYDVSVSLNPLGEALIEVCTAA